jgi:hypothetical protein
MSPRWPNELFIIIIISSGMRGCVEYPSLPVCASTVGRKYKGDQNKWHHCGITIHCAVWSILQDRLCGTPLYTLSLGQRSVPHNI